MASRPDPPIPGAEPVARPVVSRGAGALLARALVPLLMLGAATAARAAAPADRVVILGFDGADAALVERYMAEGRLPNLSKLREQGTYARLRSTNPPQTPVSWASFATGWNPGRTEIFDFLRRIDGTYVPDFAMVKQGKRTLLFGSRNPEAFGAAGALLVLVVAVLAGRLLGRGWAGTAIVAVVASALVYGGTAAAAARYLPRELPDAHNQRKGLPFWTVAAAAGIPTRVMNVPDTFPAESQEGLEMLSGLGVPDMRGRIGSPSLFTSDPSLTVQNNQFSIEVVRLPARRGRMDTAIVGPTNQPFWEYPVEEATAAASTPDEKKRIRESTESALQSRGVRRRLDVPFSLEAGDAALTLHLANQDETLKVGDWSRWLVAPIRVNPVVDTVIGLRGIVRFKLLALSPEIRLYMSPINFHPECQPIPFTSPRRLARELLSEFGLFKTLGWPIDTWSLPSGITDEAHFLEDMNYTADVQEAMMRRALDDRRARLYVQVFDFTDRIGHLFWRLLDPQHPLYDAALAARYAGEVTKAYERMDAIVGEAMQRLPPRTALIVCSDHGFASFRRGVNLNTWLKQNGFMTLRQESVEGKTLEDLFDKGELGEFFKYVDWSRTKAYAMGLGNIYVNLLGREPKGSVAPGREYDEVRDAIARGLESFVDPQTGERPVLKVYRREEMYRGFDPRVLPDLRAANADHYRVGWQTALGEVPRNVLEDNLKAWSGDHCSNDPSVVPGVLFSSTRLNADHPFIGDIYPTVLGLLGLPPASDLDGVSLLR